MLEESFSAEKLFQLIEENLVEKRLSNLFDLDNNSFNSIINFNYIPIELTSKSYFCPIYLNIADQDSYPLCFLQTNIKKEEGITLLSRSNKLPIFNKLALKHLKDLKVDVTDFTRISDLGSYLLSLEGNIQVANLSDRIKLVKKIGFYDDEILFLNKIYPFVENYLKGSVVDYKFQGLFSQIKNEEVDLKIASETQNELFSEYKKIILRFSEYSGNKLFYSDQNIIRDFINYLLSQTIAKGEAVLFIVNREHEKDDLKSLFKENNLEDFVLDLNDVEPKLLFKEIAYRGLTLEEKEQRQKFVDDENRYLTLINKRNLAYSNPRDIYSKNVINDILKAQNLKLDPLNLDITEYSVDNFKKDYNFLTEICSLKTFKDININDHLYHGLSVSGKRRNYDSLNVLLIQIINSIKDFQHTLSEYKLKDFDGYDINTFKQFEEYGKDINILSSYNGFPKKYFRINQEETALKKIEELKKLFQSISSTRLLIINICTEKIFDIDIRRVLKDLDNKFFFTRYRAKRKLLSYLNVNNQKDMFDSLVKLLTAYGKYVKTLKEEIPKYKSEFGDSIATMNGVIEIESNIKYVSSFHERSCEHPSFSMDNPAVKRCYRERSIRNHLIDEYREINIKYVALKALMNQFIGYFLDANRPYMTMPFDELIALFKKMIKGSYSEFSEYAAYQAGLENTSILLNSNLIKWVHQGGHIEDFRCLFVLSLAHAIYKRGRKRFRPELNEYERVKKSYLSTLDQTNNLYSRYLYNDVVRQIKTKQDTNEYQIEHHFLEEAYSNKEIDYIFYNTLLKHLNVTYPIIVCTANELIHSNSEICDKVVIFNSTEAGFAQLITEIMAGSHILFIEKNENADKRTLGYPDLAFSISSYLNLFDFESLPKSFYENLEAEINKHGLSVAPSSFFPLTIYDANKKSVGIILPDILIPKAKEMQIRSEFRKFIKNIYHVPVLIISMFSFLINPEQTITSVIARLSDDDYDEDKDE